MKPKQPLSHLETILQVPETALSPEEIHSCDILMVFDGGESIKHMSQNLRLVQDPLTAYDRNTLVISHPLWIGPRLPTEMFHQLFH